MPSSAATPPLPTRAAANAPREEPIYSPAELDAALRQGEILTNVAEYLVDMSRTTDGPILEYRHPFAVVLSQDCDLTQEWNQEQKKPGTRNRAYQFPHAVPNILFSPAIPASEVRASATSKQWELISDNRDIRFQFLQTVPPPYDLTGGGLGELVVDFKRLFCIPTAEVYSQIASGSALRRTRLDGCYRDHLQSRFSSFIGRVGLRVDHVSEKAI